MIFGCLVQRCCGEHTGARMETVSISPIDGEAIGSSPRGIHPQPTPPLIETTNALGYDARGPKSSPPKPTG